MSSLSDMAADYAEQLKDLTAQIEQKNRQYELAVSRGRHAEADRYYKQLKTLNFARDECEEIYWQLKRYYDKG